MNFVGNLLLVLAMKELWKSVKNWQSYRHEFDVLLFWNTLYFFSRTVVCWLFALLTVSAVSCTYVFCDISVILFLLALYCWLDYGTEVCGWCLCWFVSLRRHCGEPRWNRRMSWCRLVGSTFVH